MADELFDLAVIGGGPGGYAAALTAARHGLNVVCVDAAPDGSARGPGGTSVHAGCIPCKALAESARLLDRAKREFGEHGIEAGMPTFSLAKMQARKDSIVTTLSHGLQELFQRRGIRFLSGVGRFASDGGAEHCLEVSTPGGIETLVARSVVLATGSRPAEFPGVTVDGYRVVHGEGALRFSDVPRRLGVIGAGPTGLELASIWSRLGAQVTVLGMSRDILPELDPDMGREALRRFGAAGLRLDLGVSLEEIRVGDHGVAVDVRSGEIALRHEFDRLLVAVGRLPNSEHVDPGRLGLEIDSGGFIAVDEGCATSLPGVYAVGDVVRGPRRAHKAAAEGAMVAERLLGRAADVRYETLPTVLHTLPEVGWVGYNEARLMELGIDYVIGRFPLSASADAYVRGQGFGVVKLLLEQGGDRILGAQVIAPQASELVNACTLAMEGGLSGEDLARTSFSHPSFGEALRDAAAMAMGEALYF